MEAIRRVVIRDREPLLAPAVLRSPLSRLALGMALVAFLLQGVAIWQVTGGVGQRLAPFDHAAFALVAFGWVALGCLVLLQRSAGRVGALFLLLSAAGSAFLAFGSLYSAGLLDALVFSAGLLLFPPLLVLFARAFQNEREFHPAELLLFVPSAVLLGPSANSLSQGQTTTGWKIALLTVVLFLLATMVQAARDLRMAGSPIAAAQSRALVFGLIAGGAPGTIVIVVPLVLTGSLLVAVSWVPAIVLLFLLAMSYAVLLFEFAQADFIVRRGVVYALLTAGIIAVYGLLGVLLVVGGGTVIHPGGGLAFVAVTVLIGAAFGPVRRMAFHLVDWLLYGQRSSPWQVVDDLSRRLAVVLPPDDLGDMLVRDVVRVLHLRGAFLLRPAENGCFAVRHWQGGGAAPTMCLGLDELTAALSKPPCPVLLRHARPLSAAGSTTTPPELHSLDAHGAAFSIPLVGRGGLEAVLCLQAKYARDGFTADDLAHLALIIRQAAAALDNALLVARLRRTVDELNAAYRRIAGEQETERARLARELHDGTAQELAALITLAAVATGQLGKGEATVRSTLEKLRQQADEAYQGVRRASHALHPPLLDAFGLAATLERYIEGFSEFTGVRVQLEATAAGRLQPELALALFRIVQECLENVRKHSQASVVRIQVSRRNGEVVVSVSDDGRGLDSGETAGLGFTAMRERMASVGGYLEIESSAKRGVRLLATAPIALPAEAHR